MSQNPSLNAPVAEKPGLPGAAGESKVTDALLQDLEKDPSKARDLDRATRQEVLRRMREMEETGFEQTPGEKPPEKAAEEKKTPEPSEKKPEAPAAEKSAEDGGEKKTKAELPFDSKEARRKHQEIVDEANKWEQKVKAAEARRDKARKAKEEIEKTEAKAPDDFLDDKYQTDMKVRLEKAEKRLEFFEKLMEEKDKEEIEGLTTQHQNKEEEKIFSEIDTLQERFPELKTKRPFKQVNADYARWIDSMVVAIGKQPSGDVTHDELRKEALEKYEKDQAFRESLKVKPPEELDKLGVILSIHHRRAREGGSYKSAYLAMLDDEGVLEDVMQRGRKDAARDAALETVKVLKKKEEEISTLSPGDGASRNGFSEGELTQQSAWQFLEAVQMKLGNGHKLTPEERAKAKAIREAFGKGE